MVERRPPRKLRASMLLKPALKRLANPRHWVRAVRLSRRPRRFMKFGDSRLALLAKVLPGGFLNYGFHLPPFPRPEALSLEDIRSAQQRYGELLVEQIEGSTGRVLDVGCGMGGLLRLLINRGHEAVGLTPDAAQVAYLGEHLPDTRVIEGPFEELDAAAYRGSFAAVVTSESAQYLSLSKSLPIMKQILAPEGRWVAFDYFRIAADSPGSGHPWPEFQRALEEAGFRIESERDLTENVLPTLAFVHMWADKLGPPIVDLVASDLKRKRPGLHHVLEESLHRLRGYTGTLVERADPHEFRKNRRYRLLVIRHAT